MKSDVLHAAIMNLPCNVPEGYAPGKADEVVYRIGHRDARHAAAELALALRDQPPSVPQGAEDGCTPPEVLASRLIDAWCAAQGKPIPWEKAVEITAVITRMPDAERQRLLALNAEDAPSAPSSSQQGEADAATDRAREMMALIDLYRHQIVSRPLNADETAATYRQIDAGIRALARDAKVRPANPQAKEQK